METASINASVNLDTSAFDRAVERVKSGLSSVKSGIQSVAKAGLKMAGIDLGLEGVLKGLQAAELGYLGLETSVARVNTLFGSSAATIRDFGATSQTQFGLAETDAYRYAQVYGNLFQGMTDSADDNAQATVAMLQATAVMASKTGLTTEEVIDRVSSSVRGNAGAMAELGIQTQASALVSTEAFQKMADGRSWDQLSEKEQEQVRMLGILEQANDKYGSAVGQSSAYSLNSLGGAFDSLVAYAGMFVNAGLMPVVQWLTDIVTWATDAVKALGGFMGLSVGGTLDQPSGQMDFQNITDAWGDLQAALAPLSDTIGEGLAWFWDNVLQPFGTWAANDTVPGFLQALSGVIGVANSVIGALQPLGQWLWDNFLQPIAEWTGGTITTILAGIVEALGGVSGWIEANQIVIEALAIVIGSFAAAWGLVNLAVGVWQAVGSIGAIVTGAFAAAVNFLLSPIGLVVLAIGALIAIVVLLIKFWPEISAAAAAAWEWIQNAWATVADWFNANVIQPVVGFFTGLWTGITEAVTAAVAWLVNAWGTVANWINANVVQPIVGFFTGLWAQLNTAVTTAINLFRTAWSTVATWFNTNVVQPIAGFFTGLWDSVKKLFTSVGTTIGNAVGGAFKSAVNAVIGFVEGTINNLIRGINAAIGLINMIPGVNIRTLSMLSIPRMAQGGVVARPTIAMIGEAGREAVLPLENNTGWMTEMAHQLAAAMNGPQLAGGGDILIPVYLDGNLLDQVIVSAQERKNMRSNGR